MQDDIPMPPSHGCIVFHTPNEPNRIRWPMPNSIKNNGIPSNINITKNGIRNAPGMENEMKSEMKSEMKWNETESHETYSIRICMLNWWNFRLVENIVTSSTMRKFYWLCDSIQFIFFAILDLKLVFNRHDIGQMCYRFGWEFLSSMSPLISNAIWHWTQQQ